MKTENVELAGREDLALVLDVETTGLDSEKDKVTEAAWALWEPVEDRIVAIESTRVSQSEIKAEDYPEEVAKITGIPYEELGFGNEFFEIETCLGVDLARCKYIVGHNIEFDLGFFPTLRGLKREYLKVDTLTALPLSKSLKSRSLESICNWHNIRRPFGSHRAVLDVLNLLQVVRLYNWDVVVERAQSPVVEVLAVMSYEAMQAMAEEDRPKAHGFKWDPKRKVWFRQILECDLGGVEFPFKIKKELFSRVTR